GTWEVQLPRASFTSTRTLARWQLESETFSAVFVPLRAGCWLMSILASLGVSPSSFTVPLMLAAVAASIGVPVAAGAAVGAAGCSSFLLHPARRTNPSNAARLQTAMDVFVFMISLYLS